MSELKLISPLLDNMTVEACLRSGGGTSVYLLRNTVNGNHYMLKHISVPESQTQVEALYYTGAASNEEEAQRYYEQIVTDYEDELDALDTLRGSSNFAAYLGYQIRKKEEGIGFEIYLLSDRWPTLVEYLSENAMTHLKALNLGLDLCTALCDLRNRGLIHRDIKPDNIYLNGLGGFMLGDLGVARIDKLKYCAMPERMVTEYTAPELYDFMNPINTTIDIYSIGIVLYRILNGNHGPFEDESLSAKAANKLRVSGEPLPSPLYADYELAEIIFKACAFDPEARYQTPEDLMQDLVLYMKRNNVKDSLIVPPIITGDDLRLSRNDMEDEVAPVQFADVKNMDADFVQSFAPAERASEEDDVENSPSFAAPRHARDDEDEDDDAPATEKQPAPRKSKVVIPILIAVLLVAALAVGSYFLIFQGATLHVEEIIVLDKSSDYLTIFVDTGNQVAPLVISCVDAYGNRFQKTANGQGVTFDSLSAGTQYTITVASADGTKLSGVLTASVSTIASTEVVSFTATPVLAGQVDLNLIVSGPDPGQWIIRYTAEGVQPQEVSFTGRTVSIFNLEPNVLYTFELLPPEGVVLSGESTLEFSSGPEIEIFDLQAAELTKNSVVVTWACGEDEPEEWIITCVGTDGSTRTQTVTGREAEFTELATGEAYTITVTSAGTLTPASISVTPTAATLTSLTATVQEDRSVLVAWTADTEIPAWQLVYTLDGSQLTERLPVEGAEATLTGLLPGASYTVEIFSSAGEKLSGTTSTAVTIPAEAKFDNYGASRFFMGTFLCPNKENWTKTDLSAGTTDFAAGARIAFAVESLTGREESTDRIEAVYVVRDRFDVPVMTGSSEGEWDGIWQDDLFLGQLSGTLTEPGTYSLQLYFNGGFVASKEITIQ